jgi:excisionase family DNA binding protein
VGQVGGVERCGWPHRRRGAEKFSTYCTAQRGLRSCNTAMMPSGKGRNAMSNNIHERWLSRGELADRLGLPVKTLAQWASKGTGPLYARMGRHVRYRLSDVVEWEAARVETGTRRCSPGYDSATPNKVALPPSGRQPLEPRRGAHDDPDHL